MDEWELAQWRDGAESSAEDPVCVKHGAQTELLDIIDVGSGGLVY